MKYLLVLILCSLVPFECALSQCDLLPLDHPATALLTRINEYGGIPGFPREHLPVDTKTAVVYLREASRDTLLPQSFREASLYYLEEIAVWMGESRNLALIALDDSSDAFFRTPIKDRTLTVLTATDSARQAHLLIQPIGELDFRVDPIVSQSMLIGSLGASIRGSITDHVGFGAAATNGTVIGDLSLARRDSTISHNGSFGTTGFGRDLAKGDGYIRLTGWGCAFEIGHERISLGGGGTESLLLTSNLATNIDYVRFTANIGRFSFTHLHGSILSINSTGPTQGPFVDIPEKFVALHLLSLGPFAGLRASIGESVVYSRRGLELGYLNPLLFMKTQEQYLGDRDNGNIYFSLSTNPFKGLFLEGEFLLDDLRFTFIGDGFWGNKTAWRLGGRSIGLFVQDLSLGAQYTRTEPYVFSHFNVLNNYTHDGMSLSGAGIDPNSFLVTSWCEWRPMPWMTLHAHVGLGEHGANVHAWDSANGRDSLLGNVGGDISQTRRAGIDSDKVRFLDGNVERLTRILLTIEMEPLRSVYIRLIAKLSQVADAAFVRVDRQISLAIRVGSH